MAANYGDTVNAFYLAYYGRPADPSGLAFWTAALEKNKGDFGSIVNAFANSPEAIARFASESVSDRVSDIYQQLFGRAPEKSGLDFWVQAISSGRLSMANAAIEIMHAAQNGDAQTSTLRQQVAAQFTAEVKASGVSYDGDAAVQAARVLISAVNADSKPADIDNLVKAGASLVQTAHDNPAVIKALANGGDLSAVLNTASGKADPVAVVQALASIGKAALTDSAGLSTLLQGGGMTGLLNSLPAGTSVKDVATAVSNGGLSAGAVAANPPPVDVPPAIAPTIAFVGPDGKDLPADTTLVANSIWYFIAVHGKPSGASTTFEVSSTGNANDWKAVSEDVDLADGSYFVRYTVKDAAGNSGTSNVLKLVMDHSVPFLNMSLAEDTGSGAAGTATDHISSNGAVKISGLHANETWFYSFDGKSWTSGSSDANGMATIAAPGADGVKNLTVRTLENVGGKSQFTSTAFKYTLDTTAPGQGLKLVSVGGTAGNHSDLAKGDVVFSYTGTIDANKAEALFYRINTNVWSTANNTIVDDVKKTVTFKDVDLSHGPVQIVIQTKDAAGNVLDLSSTVTGQADTTPPAAPTGLKLQADTGVAGDGVTTNGNFIVSGLAQGALWEFSSDGKTWYRGTPANVDGVATGSAQMQGEQTLQVRTYDLAGNISKAVPLHFTFDDHRPADGLSLDGAVNYAYHTTQATTDLVFHYTGTISASDVFEYSNMYAPGDTVWNKIDSSMIDTNVKTITFHNFDLNKGDAYLTIHGTSVAGIDAYYQQGIDGPYTSYFMRTSTAGPNVLLSAQQTAHLYLTDGGNVSAQITTLDPSGDLVSNQNGTGIGVQTVAVQGVLGVGNDAQHQTVNTTSTYALGTAGGDTLSGNFVWGYDGDDTITVAGNPGYSNTIIVGGAGADQIHMETSTGQLLYKGSQDSSIIADASPAHGFDTVYVSKGGSTGFQIDMKIDGLKLGDYYKGSAAPLNGTETGMELLAAIDKAGSTFFKTTGDLQLALVSFGADSQGRQVNFLAIDTDKDGHIGTGDFVVEIVGSIGASGFGNGSGFGSFSFSTAVTLP
jgi:hypothetical protein